MPKKRSVTIDVKIAIVGGNRVFTYKPRATTYCDQYGNISVPEDTILTITWKTDEQWDFEAPFLSARDAGAPLVPKERKKKKTRWECRNTIGQNEFRNFYYLHTDLGRSPDPSLTLEGNSGGGGFLPKKKSKRPKKAKKAK